MTCRLQQTCSPSLEPLLHVRASCVTGLYKTLADAFPPCCTLQVAADMRFLQQIRSRSTAVQQEHEALLAAAEESVRAARTAKVGPAPAL